MRDTWNEHILLPAVLAVLSLLVLCLLHAIHVLTSIPADPASAPWLAGTADVSAYRPVFESEASIWSYYTRFALILAAAVALHITALFWNRRWSYLMALVAGIPALSAYLI